MPRIGRQIPHYEHVDLNSLEAVFSADRIYRYSLSMRYSDTLIDAERREHAAVIMKNPSAADEQQADATIRKVETYIYHRFPGVRWLHILNIFAYRATDPADLNAAFADNGAMYVIGGENDHVIGKIIEDCDYIVLAWGNSSGIDRTLYEERVYRTSQLLQAIPRSRIFTICGRTRTKHPLHGLMWGYDYTINPVGKYLDDK